MTSVMPLVGRDAEVARLRDLVVGCAGGRSEVLVLTGEAGVGTSRLVQETAALARAHGVRRIRARFSPGERDLPLAAFRRGLAGAPVAGEARDRLEAVLRTAAGRDVRLQVVQSAVDATIDLVRARQPLVFLLEDVHWADPESLQVIRAAARRATDLAVGVVLSGRPRPRPPGLSSLLAMEGIVVEELVVGPLDHAAVDQLVLAALGGLPGPALRRELDRTGGNALLVTQLLAEVRRAGDVVVEGEVADLRPGATATAPDLTAHVAARLAAMGPAARQVVALVALADLTPVQLARLLGGTVAGLAPALHEAVADGLVVADGAHLRLHHDLLRDAVLAPLPEAVRAGLEADLVEVLAPEAGAVRPPPSPRSLEAVAEAGRRLVGTAPAAAASLLRRAHRGGVPGAAEDLAAALVVLGQVAEAEEVLAIVGDTGGAQTRTARAQLAFLRGDLRGAAAAFEAVAAAADGQPEGRLALVDAAIARLLVGHLDRAEQLATTATDADEGPVAQAATGAALLVRGCAAALRGDLERAVALATRGHAIAVAAPDGAARAHQPDLFLALVLLWADRPHAAASAVQGGLERAREVGTTWAVPMLQAVEAAILLRAGRWDEAAAALDDGLGLVGTDGVEHGLPWCAGARAALAAARGEDPGPMLAVAAAAAGRLGGQGGDVVLWARGRVLLQRHRHADAAQVLGLLWARLDRAGQVLRQVQVAPDLVRAAVVADPERAVAVEQRLAALTGRGWRRAEAAWVHARGLVAREPLLVAQAAAVLAALEDPVGAALAYADAARIAGSDPSAAGHRQAAAQVFEAAGAAAWLDDLRGTAPPPPSAVASGFGALTPSQARVVHLVGEGLGNAEIAARLGISRRTVESHLYHAYDKLGLSSRLQLGVAAARAGQQGWLPPP